MESPDATRFLSETIDDTFVETRVWNHFCFTRLSLTLFKVLDYNLPWKLRKSAESLLWQYASKVATYHIVNFPFFSSNILSGPSYGVYISQLIRYARCCSHCDDFRYRHKCSWLIDFCHKAMQPWGLRSLSEILWQISGSHWEIPYVSQSNGQRFITRIIFI